MVAHAYSALDGTSKKDSCQALSGLAFSLYQGLRLLLLKLVAFFNPLRNYPSVRFEGPINDIIRDKLGD